MKLVGSWPEEDIPRVSRLYVKFCCSNPKFDFNKVHHLLVEVFLEPLLPEHDDKKNDDFREYPIEADSKVL